MTDNIISNNDNYSQSQQILNYLQTGNALTALDAIRLFNCLQLGARTYDLRQQRYISDLAKGVGTHVPNISRVKGECLYPHGVV